MDWQKQTQDMMKVWTDTQKKVWDNWTESMKSFSTVSNPTEAWVKSIETWHGMVNNGIEVQHDWAKMWVDSVAKVDGVPAPMVEWTKQAFEMNTQVSNLQKQMWSQWFEFVKKLEPGKMPQFNSDEGKQMFQLWQDAVQNVAKVQTDWFNTVTGAVKNGVATATAPASKK